MFDEEDRETGYALFLAIGLAIFVSIFAIGLAAGTAISQSGGKSPVAGLPLSGSVAPGTASVAAVTAVRLYFDLGKSDLPDDALTQLTPLFESAKEASSARWIVSGYHDASGDAAANAELAKQRAFAVRDLLVHAGVDVATIELSKPIETMGGDDPRAARRVEVTLR